MGEGATMGGHVFVVRGDVRQIRCDARLVSVYETHEPKPEWFHEEEQALRTIRADESWRARTTRVRQLGSAGSGPTLWVAKVGLGHHTTLNDAMESVSQFLDRASAALDRSKLVSDRCKPLLALHVVATGLRNSGAQKGDAIVRLLALVDECAAKHDVDVVIVAHEEEAYAAVQVTRSTRRNGVSPELDPPLHDLARELAQKARHGDLSALVGAGLSMNAGLPSWWKLLATAATAFEVGPCDEGEDALAYASRIERKAGPDRFRQAILEQCQPTRYALGHALLASTPIREFVTLNYDQLLEGAARDAGAPLTVIPHGRVKAKDRWLLKLHGSVDRPKDIVITAQDYAGFDEWRAAFKGVIEAQLITRHMLFVGFGMADPNVDKVLTTVARAAQGDDGQKGDTVGTVLMFSSTIPDKYAQLYPLRFVCVGPADMTSAERARQLEILLDEVARIAEDGTHHLLDRRFDGLHVTEVAVREKVADFLTGLHATHPDSRLRREIMERLRPLMGGDPRLTPLLNPK
ncbi:MAG: SIR2 family protein [Deltaproteobacteria bacterium]|nr:SIR2 family protein [Deltaproteobacteria bacterium]